MKKIGKRVLSLFLVALMVVSVMPMTKIQVDAATYTYNPTAALNFAKNHCARDISLGYTTNGYGTGYCEYNWLCAAFVSQCIKAGGFSKVYDTYAYNLGRKLQNYGKKIDCYTKNGALIKASDFASPLTPGDIIVWECGAPGSNAAKKAGSTGHVAIYAGTASDGAILVYAHNKRINGGKMTMGSKAVAKYAIHLSGESEENSDPYVNKSVTKITGTYCSNNNGVYLRSVPGTTTGSRVGYVPRYTEICVTETKYNWGKCTYNGVTGWTCLDYYTYKAPVVLNIPSLNQFWDTNIPVNSNITLSWSSVANATGYKIQISGATSQTIDVGATTSTSLTLDKTGTYNFKVMAYNGGTNSGWSSAVSCTTHAPSTVTFVDSDGTVLDKVVVDYGENVSAPAPSKEGYTFQGWDGSTYNITQDVTLKAQYTVNTYYVKFWGADDKQLGETQKVKYGEDATPPEDTNAPENYKFVNWSSEEYKNVFTDSTDKTINIYAIYEWANENIPITCEITKAYRDSDGYHVLYNLTNNVSDSQTGRAIITLKTAEGKLVYTTESKAFSIPGNTDKSDIDEFFECDETASVIEIIVVDSYTTGVPISKSVSAEITDGLSWSNWIDGEAPEGVEAEEQTVYRYRDKETSTASTQAKDGWTWDGTRSETAGAWSAYSDSAVSAYDTEQTRREVRTQSVPVYSTRWLYVYYHFYKSGGGSHTYCPSNHAGGTYHGIYYNYSPFTWKKYSDCGGLDMYTGLACDQCGASGYWWYNSGDSGNQTYQSGTKTQYSYRDITYTYNFWRWKEWSDWSATAVTETTSRDVETKTQYRTYNGVEDITGEVRTLTGSLGSEFAGKNVTLFVYKYDEASDYTDEYVGQTVTDENGNYEFTYKLREEPTVKTGDFTIALGIEGTTNTYIVGKIEAPVPEYTVNFYDVDGTILETQTVKQGENAVLPATVPAKDGYDFKGWSESLTNIRQDIDIFPNMEQKEYQVIFVDWENEFIEIKTFKHGDILTTPEYSQVEGHTFAGWDKINEGNSVVTCNMVVTAEYEANTYTVKFYDFDGNVVDTQEINYGETAVPPETVESQDGKQFAGWFNPEEYEYIEKDVAVYPAYYFEETCGIPIANYESGEFSDSIELTLSSEDENDVIYYFLNGDESTEAIYTEPVVIDKTTSVTFYATSLGKNDSDSVTNYYCINKDTVPSEWMLYSELPAEVTENIDDYTLESATGYRYKDTVETSSVAAAENYLSSGWIYDSSVYTDYTGWQDEQIADDGTLLDLDIETQEVEDTSTQRYKFTRYKYTDGDGNTAYSYTDVEGYECTLEETHLELSDSAASPVGFVDGNTSVFYWLIDGEQWFNRTKVNGVKTQYRSRHKTATYYKWTAWDVTVPSSSETRAYETDTVYRFSDKVYHIVVVNGFSEGDTLDIRLIENGSTIDKNSLEFEGYDLVDLYCDDTYATLFGLNTPITESVTLYAKYEPKEYTVTFQMEGGLELDTQTVKYMEAASEPESFTISGYVFGGWDKDFGCVTEDMTVTGKYFKETEYARVSLEKNVLDMYQGNTLKLNYEISPADLSEESVEWSSSDPNVVAVDDKGNITALVPGEATITVTVTKTKETSTCTVTVNEDVGNYIVIKPESSLNHDDLGYLRRIGFNTSVKTACDEFRNQGLVFYNISGTELSETDIVGTGTTINLFSGDSILDTETVIVTGDMTGDGLLNNRDVAMVNRYLVGKVSPQESQILALDLNGDGYINNKDAAMAARYLVGKDVII